MNRRQALQNLALISAGIALLPACDFETWPEYEHIPLESDHKKLIKWLTEAIIPKGEIEIATPEPRAHFVLTMVNDCYESEDIEKYRTGMQNLVQHLKEAGTGSLKGLTPEESDQLIVQLIGDELLDENIRYFLQNTRRLSIQHFTSSQYFMENHLDFHFIPGWYNGCVQV